MLSNGLVYECDTDAMFLRLFRQRAEFEALFFKLATGRTRRGYAEVLGQQRHVGSAGSIDLVLKYAQGPIILIENKIDAGYSVTREGHGQPHRYQKTIAAYRSQGAEVYSVVLAPEYYLNSSRLAHMFDARISYENLRETLGGGDLTCAKRRRDGFFQVYASARFGALSRPSDETRSECRWCASRSFANGLL